MVEEIEDYKDVFAFAKIMAEMLKAKQRLGRYGWRDEKICPISGLDIMLVEQMQKYLDTKGRKHLVHLANFCMMLYFRQSNRKERILER